MQPKVSLILVLYCLVHLAGFAREANGNGALLSGEMRTSLSQLRLLTRNTSIDDKCRLFEEHLRELLSRKGGSSRSLIEDVLSAQETNESFNDGPVSDVLRSCLSHLSQLSEDTREVEVQEKLHANRRRYLSLENEIRQVLRRQETAHLGRLTRLNRIVCKIDTPLPYYEKVGDPKQIVVVCEDEDKKPGEEQALTVNRLIDYLDFVRLNEVAEAHANLPGERCHVLEEELRDMLKRKNTAHLNGEVLISRVLCTIYRQVPYDLSLKVADALYPCTQNHDPLETCWPTN